MQRTSKQTLFCIGGVPAGKQYVTRGTPTWHPHVRGGRLQIRHWHGIEAGLSQFRGAWERRTSTFSVKATGATVSGGDSPTEAEQQQGRRKAASRSKTTAKRRNGGGASTKVDIEGDANTTEAEVGSATVVNWGSSMFLEIVCLCPFQLVAPSSQASKFRLFLL